ncbi:MAG: plastocyanin/azurin family copper-binding protein [Tepidiformaceae bacterium]
MTMKRVLISWLAAAGLAIAAVAFGLAGGSSPATAADQAVTIQNFAFTPASVTINVGEKVTWTNQQAGVPHTVSSNTGVTPAFDQPVAAGASTSVTFAAAGTFGYHCNIHPEMLGTVIVQAAAASPTAASPGATASPAAPATGSGLASGERAGGFEAGWLALGAAFMIAAGGTAAALARREGRAQD